jgi:hypothetical protein
VIAILRQYEIDIRSRFADAPPDIQRDYFPSDSLPSVSESEILELERSVPFTIPRSFRTYLTGPSMECGPESGEIILPGNRKISSLAEMCGAPDLWSLGLLQFASGPCGDPVCFDFLTGGSEPPVVVINHDWATEDDWKDPVQIRRWVSASWGTFASLLRDVCEKRTITFRTFAAEPAN